MIITYIIYIDIDTLTMTILTFLALYICLRFSKSILFISNMRRGTKRVVNIHSCNSGNFHVCILMGEGLKKGIQICVSLNFCQTDSLCIIHQLQFFSCSVGFAIF